MLDQTKPTQRKAARQRTGRWDWRNYLLAGLATLSATAIALVLARYLALPNISLVFLAAVLVVAVRSSLGPALACAGLSFLFYDFLFIPPTFTFIVARQEDVLTLLFFLLMAILAGNLASRQKRQLEALRQTQAQTTALLELSRRLGAATDVQAVCSVAVHQLQLLADIEALVAMRDKQAAWIFKGDLLPSLTEQEQAAAQWAWKHGQQAGQGTDTLPEGHWWWLPLSGDGQPLGLLGIRTFAQGRLPPDRRRLVCALAQPLAQALGRAMLADELEAARLHGQTEELRSALLASVSHDLRTPLTAMRGSIDCLASLGHSMSEDDRRELLETTRDEAERLDRYIQNLLDMTRLGHGGLKAHSRLGRTRRYRRQRVATPAARAGRASSRGPAARSAAVAVCASGTDRTGAGQCAGKCRAVLAPGGRLQVAVDAGSNALRFVVSDEGPGIPEAEREKIFDMFYTAARGDRGGPGLVWGSPSARNDRCPWGRVAVGEGLDGRGASVTLELPLQPQPAMDMESDLT